MASTPQVAALGVVEFVPHGGYAPTFAFAPGLAALGVALAWFAPEAEGGEET